MSDAERRRLDEEYQRRKTEEARQAAKQLENDLARRNYLSSFCTNCQAANARAIGTLCFSCHQALNPPEPSPTEPLDYSVLTAYEDSSSCWGTDALADDLLQAELERHEYLQTLCLNCLAPHSRAIGTLCAGCWNAQNAGERFPEPSHDAPQEAWDIFLDQLPRQAHHLASDKGDALKGHEWTEMAWEIANRYDLDLDDDWNLLVLPHNSTHPPEYHAFIIGSMLYAQDEAGEDKERFLALFKECVTDVVEAQPQMTRWNAWGR